MIEVRPLTTHDEFAQALDVQRTVWGFADVELLPVRLFVVATKVGGQVFGAFDGERMAGFCIAIPGIKTNGLYYLHSHMLGVLPEYRDHGVGRRLKLAQREEALSRSIELVEWTFDPLELKNAYFNIERLGVVIRRYVLNQYGTTSSHLHGGLPTDRCVAEWWVSSSRAGSFLAGEPIRQSTVEARIEVPAAIERLRKDEPKRAREIQKALGDRFLECFDRGLAVIGFERSADKGAYLLGAWDENR